VQKEVRAKLLEHADSDSFPLLPQRIIRDLRSTIADDAILSLDNGMYKVWFARHFPAYHPNTLLLDNALATMGAGLPVAMAAKLVHPNRQVVAICGDGGFMMNSQELETAVRLGLNLVCVILNDSAYGMIKWKQAAMGFENWGLDYKNPDFVRYAESYGAHGHRIEKASQFTAVLKESLNQPGVHVIDLPIDYSQNKRLLTDELLARKK
jgi:acetolactate synthase-1/2/3 large subunit